MCSAPSNVPVVAYEALIAPVSYFQCLLGPVGGLSILHRARGVKINPSFSQLCLPHPTLFYSTQKIGKISDLPPLSQIGALFQPFFLIYVAFSIDNGQVCSV